MTTIRKIGVVGAGEMGTGIAQACAAAGFDVHLHDVGYDILQRALMTIGKICDRLIQKGKMAEEEKEATLSRIKVGTDFSAFADCDLIIESVTENEEIKREVYRSLSEHLDSDAMIASNTSSISITRLAATTDRPAKFMGMHFMNPVSVMPLVELIRGIATDEDTFNALADLTRKLGKTAAVAEDFPAFIVNRILLPMINEAIYTLYEGVGDVTAIDAALKLGARHPMGPLELADFIGLDNCLGIMQVLYEGLADSKYRPCPLLVKYVEAGWLGRKAGRGFYDYSKTPPAPTR